MEVKSKHKLTWKQQQAVERLSAQRAGVYEGPDSKGQLNAVVVRNLERLGLVTRRNVRGPRGGRKVLVVLRSAGEGREGR